MIQFNGLFKGSIPSIGSDHLVPQYDLVFLFWLWNFIKHMAGEFEFVKFDVKTGEFVQ
ncbi:hypothetical protein LguiB_002125 [Lonicera macranthoides]